MTYKVTSTALSINFDSTTVASGNTLLAKSISWRNYVCPVLYVIFFLVVESATFGQSVSVCDESTISNSEQNCYVGLLNHNLYVCVLLRCAFRNCVEWWTYWRDGWQRQVSVCVCWIVKNIHTWFVLWLIRSKPSMFWRCSSKDLQEDLLLAKTLFWKSQRFFYARPCNRDLK